MLFPQPFPSDFQVVEEVSFEAADYEPGHKIVIDAEMVRGRMANTLKVLDLRKYIL